MDANKEKCKYLKSIRKEMADKLGIDLRQQECTYEGECSGTCPKCEQEENTLNQALFKKGLAAASAIGLAVGLTGCTPKTDMQTSGLVNMPRDVHTRQEMQTEIPAGKFVLTGDVAYSEPFHDDDSSEENAEQNSQDKGLENNDE